MAKINEGIDIQQAVITIDDIAKLLRDADILVGNETFPDDAKKYLFDFFNKRGNYYRFGGKKFTLDEAREFLVKAKNATMLLGQYLPNKKVVEMTKTMVMLEEKTVEELSRIYSEALDLYKDEKVKTDKGEEAADIGLDEFVSKVARGVIGEASVKKRQYVDGELDRLTAAFFIYKELKPYLVVEWDKENQKVVRKVDEEVLAIVSNKEFKKITTKQTKEIFETLTNGLGKDNFSKEEVANLITQTNSVLTNSSKKQIETCQDCIHKYREHLIQLAGDDKKFEQYIDKYINLKYLCDKAGTILNVPADTQYQVFDMLTGKSLGEMDAKYRTEYEGISRNLITKVSKFKFNFTPSELFFTLASNPSSLKNLNTNRMLDIAVSFDGIMNNLFPNGSEGDERLKKDDFKLENFATVRNFADLFISMPKIENTKKYTENIKNYAENIKTLNKVMCGSEVFKVMQSNHMLFMCDSDKIKLRVDEIINECNGDLELLSQQINDFVNQSFNALAKNGANAEAVKGQKRRKSSRELEEIFTYTPIQVVVDGGIEMEATTTTTKKAVRAVKATHKKDAPQQKIDNTKEDVKVDTVSDTNNAPKQTKKVKTFSDVLKGADVSDKCINLLKQEIEEFKDMLNNVGETGELDMSHKSELNTEDVISIKIKRIAKLSNKAEELLSKEDAGFIKDLKEKVLQECISDIKHIYNSVKEKVETIKSLISIEDVKRGKKVSKTSAETGELLGFMSSMATSARQSKNEKNKKLMMDTLQSFKEETKEEIATSQKAVNKTRVDNYGEAINYLRQYSTYNKALNTLEKEFPELIDEQAFGR